MLDVVKESFQKRHGLLSDGIIIEFFRSIKLFQTRREEQIIANNMKKTALVLNEILVVIIYFKYSDYKLFAIKIKE
jgi:hypothetical protein